jgi:hypothetical protein
MLVCIDVVERESGRSICLELRLDFCCDLPTDRRAHEYIESETNHVAAKTPGVIDEIRQAFRRQHRPALYEDEMQADAQSRQPPRARNRVLRRRSSDHEACSREDAALMRGFDSFIDFARKPEIVGRDDNLFQSAGSWRSRKNLKNSMPSRSRRRNISGLLSISPAIAAIFGARK